MNREKRQFVHEYCEHFGCESVAYDQEPKRNVVATAQKAKVSLFNFVLLVLCITTFCLSFHKYDLLQAWLPSVGLLELVQREAGQRKVPGPILNSAKSPVSRSVFYSLVLFDIVYKFPCCTRSLNMTDSLLLIYSFFYPLQEHGYFVQQMDHKIQP